MFSFNSNRGACGECNGAGIYTVEEEGGHEHTETCPACDGERLNPVSAAVRVGGHRLPELGRMTPSALMAFISDQFFPHETMPLPNPSPGKLGKMSFPRAGGTGLHDPRARGSEPERGEVQRVRLAAQLCARLSGVLYVLDEPTIGLHPKDNTLLLGALDELVNRGNSVVVVEHDEDTIRKADCVVEMGPGGGTEGGNVLRVGSLESLLEDPNSLTGQCLKAGGKGRAVRRKRPVSKAPSIVIEG